MTIIEKATQHAILLGLLLLFLGFPFAISQTRAQQATLAQTSFNGGFIVGSLAHTAISPSPTAGTYGICSCSDGIWAWSNTVWVRLDTPPAASGVTSIAVCNAAGASCGPAQAGAVSLSIPTKVTVAAPGITVTPPAVSSASTLAALSTPGVVASAPAATLQ
jgi:hypothetical protein